MKYHCRNCNREFDIPAMITYRPTINFPAWPYTIPWPYTSSPQQQTLTYDVQKPCCPFCESVEIEETKP